ncbi:autotransporter assembly complex protein TamA [Chondromyces apiculatus]|uniref:Outer membrane protein assembly factor YaeT n=1 Tax=Chondromyces apiculatus DSM 436 TaxID=1192034 RepID=A0A017TD42_9BACT|nr:BamA/TamA family outer membrane protein [Chondromyces apiculatus]EYF07139.1 Outer membrane protein assembly factor YaeT precursor [Chondromyces apiculatus DSM 436]
MLGTLCSALALFFLGIGCRDISRPPCSRPDLSGCPIDAVYVDGNAKVGGGDIEGAIATAESSRLLGGALENVPILRILDVVSVKYERFDRFVLERDLARVERYYQARGYYSARARAGRVHRIEDREGGRVAVEIVVEEGVPVVVGAIETPMADRPRLFKDKPACQRDLGKHPVRLEWSDAIANDMRRVLGAVVEARNNVEAGEPFDESTYEDTKGLILRALTERGFPYAKIEGYVCVDLVARKAQVTYQIKMGPRSRFGPVKIEGLDEIPERPIRAAIKAIEGEPFSTDKLDDSQRALSEFGVFGAIDIEIGRSPEGEPENPVVPITFKLQPARLRSVKLGGGGELGGRTEVHLVAGWEDRNFLGGLRRFTVEARPGLVFYPTTISTLFDDLPSDVLFEAQLKAELRQPDVIDPRTTAVFRGALRRYRLQSSQFNREDVVVEGKEKVVGYYEYSGAVGLERPFLRNDILTAALYYNLQLNQPFAYINGPPPAGFRTLLLPYLQSVVTLDLRRDSDGKLTRIAPHKGFWASVDAELAGYIFGDANDVRLQPEIRGYLPVTKKTTLALRLMVGMLFPTNYGTAFTDPDSTEIQRARDLQVLQFRAFFSGGPNSNRGYPYNQVGPHDNVPSLTGLTNGLVPTGGLSLWEASVELRTPIVGDLGAAFFLDASDVTRTEVTYRLTHPHLSTGLGLRYATPIGPLRVDLGFRIPCVQVAGVCPNEPLPVGEGKPDELLGLPLAFNLGIGEAF